MINPIDNLLGFPGEFFQKKELKPLFAQIGATARYLWDRGWSERNAGNFSVNVTGHFTSRELEKFTTCPFYPFSGHFPGLAGNLFLVSGTGTRMRDIAVNPHDHICFLYIAREGDVFHLLHARHDETPVLPTSELNTHLAIQQQFVRKNAGFRVVLHAHVTELIALTHFPEFNSEESVNRLLSSMHPEINLFLPGGVGYIPYELAGTEQIAKETIKHLAEHKALIWEKHGCIAVSDSLDDAFDTLDMIAKAAAIYFLVASAGRVPEGLLPQQIAEIHDLSKINQ